MGPYIILVSYLLLGVFLIRRTPVNDMERSMLDLDHEEMADRYAREFGGVLPRRMPFRLPMEYWLWNWTRNLTHARYVALAVSTVGVWFTLCYATQLGGPRAGVIAGAIILSNSYVVRNLCSASYVPYVATLWVGGLYALSAGRPLITFGCGVTLALLRPTSWGAALWLLWMSGGVAIASGLAALIWIRWPGIIRSQGWWRLIRCEPCPVAGIPQDGWGYGLKTWFQRYESWTIWATVALLLGHWSSQGAWLIGLSVGLFMLTHFPRMLIRPKWAVGYFVDFSLPIAVGLAVMLAS